MAASSSKSKAKSKRGGLSIYHAFPIIVAIGLWYLLSQQLFTQFTKPLKNTEKQSLLHDDSDLSIVETDETTAIQPIKNPTRFAMRHNFLKSLNDSIAEKTYPKKFTVQEWEHREKILAAEFLVESNQLKAATMDLKILAQLIPKSPRFLYASGRLIDKMSEFEQSNFKLKNCIDIYKKIIDMHGVDPSLIYVVGKRLINRLQFRGKVKDAIIYSEILTMKIPHNSNLINDLGISLLLFGKPSLAKDQFEKVLKISDNQNLVALCHYAFILKTSENKFNESVQFFTKCLASKDKTVMDARFFYHFGDALQRLDRTREAYEYYKIAVENDLFLSEYQRSLYNEPNLKSKPWWRLSETKYENDLMLLEDNWKIIRDEAMAQMNKKSGLFVTEEENLRDTGDWKQFNLFLQGEKVEKNCEKTPYTCFLIEKITAAHSCTRGQVKFSLMRPGTHVWPHCGPTNCRLRAHLGLKVSAGAKIRVADEEKTWENGRIIVFDDSFEHEVWHNGDELRLILIVDLWHPDLSELQKQQMSPI